MFKTRRTILLVYDDWDLLQLLAIRLESAGHDLVTADSGVTALASIAASRPQLVITDLRMNGMDGITLFDLIKKDDPALPVIILTAQGTIPDAVAATQRGVFSYLTKPYEGPKLIEAVEAALKLGGSMALDHESQWRSEIITRACVMEDLLTRAKRVAAGDANVFVSGDRGTGKELLARAIHKASPRRQHPFVAVNCAAVPEELLESDLFGNIKGTFGGAFSTCKGVFHAADKGTLLLDEIDDMPPSLQGKLSRVLEDRQIRLVGSPQSVPLNVRIISTSHRDLETAKDDGAFRDDLFYRLNGVSLKVPPLAQRREDVPLLATHFLRRLAERHGKCVNAFAPDALEMLMLAPWPGNVRQLYKIVEEVVALSTSPLIPATLVQSAISEEQRELDSFDEARRSFELGYLTELLTITEGNVTQAAKLARRNRTEFYRMLHKCDLNPSLFKQRSQALHP